VGPITPLPQRHWLQAVEQWPHLFGLPCTRYSTTDALIIVVLVYLDGVVHRRRRSLDERLLRSSL